ncbi:hypothetical protein GCM10007231_27900 [Nocardioides daphniae]|uniref:Uncharacterized protein n=1 Tax=Nocardioides daphniae TaxID=402297 RepID=A0ABQ1QHM2_9ACTN|nr:hypothetical protein GCM10007231_27900 [Nocardioides daphniae]
MQSTRHGTWPRQRSRRPVTTQSWRSFVIRVDLDEMELPQARDADRSATDPPREPPAELPTARHTAAVG